MPRQKAASRKNVETQTEVPCSCKRKVAAKKNVETQTEVPCTHVRKAAAKKNVETQTEVPKQDASVLARSLAVVSTRTQPLQC